MNRAGPVFEEFEPRILYSADLAPLALAGMADHQVDAQAVSVAEGVHHEIAFVDLSLPDAQTLIDDLRAQAQAGRDIEVVAIGSDVDGIALISDALAQRKDIGALHLLSHGSDGALLLGNSRLDPGTLLARAGELAGWGAALTADADLLLYGCDVAAGTSGHQLVADLAALTGADVAASTDPTGAALRGGDWVLEVASGSIQTSVALTSQQQSAWQQLMLLPTNEITVNTTTINDQTTSAEDRGSQQAVATDAAGNYVVVWTSTNQDGDKLGVYARRFDANGVALTGEILVNTTTADNQRSARVVSDAAGNFVVTWTSSDGSGDSVHMRRFAANGVALTAETRVNTTTAGTQSDAVIAMNASNGDYVVVWQGQGPGDSAGIFFRRFNADGSAKDASDRLANLTDGGIENDPAVAMDASGNFVVCWEQGKKLYFQRFDATGATLGGRVQIDNVLATSSGPSVATDAAGNFTVVYREENLLPGIWGKGFNADGTVRYSWFWAAAGDAASPTIDVAADGSHVVVYQSSGDGDGQGVYARFYNADGSPASTPVLVNQTTAGDQSRASVALVDASNFVVAWSGNSVADSQGVVVRQFNSTNWAPVITSSGGGATGAVNVAENSTAVTTVTATDPNVATTLTYSIVGGLDAAKFSINTSTGALRFVAAPDFESPGDVGPDNVYDVTVQVSDGQLVDTQALAIRVTPVNEMPQATSDSYTVAQDGTLTVPAATGLLANDSDPDGDSLTVASVATPAHGTVSLLPAALTGFTNLSQNAAADTRADWSPDGTRIAFDSARDGNNEIYVMNADGTSQVRLTNNGSDDSQAAWSPDGSRIAFMSNRSGNYEVWRMNADGSGLVQLTNTASAISGQPAWSPDGSKIAFTSDRGGANYDLYVMNADGSNVTRLTNITGSDAEPVWSPDGTRIAFSSTRDGNGDIYVMNADGSGQTRLTNNAALDRAPSWSYVGSKIAFVSDRSGSSQIWMMDANGANAVAITAQAGGVTFPAVSSDGTKVLMALGNEIQVADLRFDGSFVYTPTPGYVGADSFTYVLSDGNGLTTTGTVNLTVTAAANTAPTITSNAGGSTAAVSVAENTRAVTTVTATDADLPAQTLNYAITGGVDAAKFSIDAATGALAFVAAPDFEAPGDVGANNVYDVVVRVSDGALTDLQAIAVTVTNLGEALQTTPEQLVNTTTAAAQATVLEDRGSTAAVAVASSGDYVVVWSSQNQDGSGWGVYGQRFDRTGAAVGSEFLVNQTTAGDQLWASVAIDDAGRFVVSWTGVDTNATQSIYARTYAADGSASSAEFRVNTTFGGDQHNGAVAMDAMGNFIVVWEGNGVGDTDGIFGRRFTVTGVAIDATEFRASTDVSRPHFDPAVAMNASGAFAITWDDTVGTQVRRFDSSGAALGADVTVAANVTAGDAAVALAGDGSMVVVWRETVGDRNVYLRRYDASGTALTAAVQVNTTTTLDQISPSIAMDGAGNFIVSWEGNGSGDASGVYARKFDNTGSALGNEFLLNTTTTGAQTMASVAMLGLNDFVAAWTGEGPGDSSGVFSRQFGTINVAPTITSDGGGAGAAVNLAENTQAVTTVTATDLDTWQTLSYAITGGADASKFSIDATTGVLSFIAAPNFEAPTDVGANNVYDVVVQVSDGTLTDSQAIAVTVTNANEAPVITSNGGGATSSVAAAENQLAVATVTATDVDATSTLSYAITGGADASKFSIDASTGVLSFIAAPNFEAPTDVGANNVYDVVVQVSDGALTDSQAMAVTVTNATDAPAIVANSLVIAEGGSATPSLIGVDADTPATQLVYSVGALTGGRFEMLGAPGVAVLSFTQADVDAGTLRFVHDGGEAAPTYTLSLSDGSQTTPSLAASVVFTPVNDAPLLLPVDLGGLTEDTVRLITQAELLEGASDAEGQALSVSNLVLLSGQATLVDNGNGSWLLTPEADWSGGITLGFDVGDGSALVRNVAGLAVAPAGDAPRITSLGGGANATLSIAENSIALATVAATDVDLPAQTLVYSISGGADAAQFRIDARTGVLSFATAPDREQPADVGADNRYDVTVRASDGVLFGEQQLAVDIGNVDEAPTLVRNDLVLNSGSVSVVLLASDPDTPATALVYQVSGVVGGQFESSAAPGAALASFTHAEVLAGSVNFVADASGMTPSYALQLSDGTSTSNAAAPTVVDNRPATITTTTTAVDDTSALPAPAAQLPAATVPSPAVSTTDVVPRPAAPQATAPDSPPPDAGTTSDDNGLGGDAALTLVDRATQRSSGGAILPTELRATTHQAIEWTSALHLQLELLQWAQAVEFEAGAGNDAPRQDFASALRERTLTQALDGLRRGVEQSRDDSEPLVVGSTAVSAGLSVGYVLWLARGGMLMASVLSALPAWASLDPLPVLGQVKGKGRAGTAIAAGDDDDENDDDAVEHLFDKARSAAPPSAAVAAAREATP